jgi:hypothetical protein
VQGDDQHVHKATWPPLAVRVKNNEELRSLQFTYEQYVRLTNSPW